MAVSTQRYIDQDFCLASPATPATPPRRGGEGRTSSAACPPVARRTIPAAKPQERRRKTAALSLPPPIDFGMNVQRVKGHAPPLLSPSPHPRVFDTRAPRLSHATLLSMGSLFLGRARIDAPCLWNSGRRKQTRRRDMASTWNKDTRDFVFYTGQLCRPGVLSTRNYRGK